MITVGIMMVMIIMSTLLTGTGQNYTNKETMEEVQQTKNDSSVNVGNKLVIINFDDSYDGQFTYAKPILDKYSFKATFFEICGRLTENSWRDIVQLEKDGMDIEAHTMTHPDLTELSDNELDSEIGGAKDCFLDNGVNTTIFAYPYGKGWNDEKVLSKVAENYDLARTDSKHPLTFLNCDLWNNIPYGSVANDSSNSMPSCIRSSNDEENDDGNDEENDDGNDEENDDGNADSTESHSGNMQQTLGSSRYAINSWSHRHIEGRYDYEDMSCIGICQSYNNSQMLKRFIEMVNSQVNYNKDGIIRAIPIIVYHDFVAADDVSENKVPTDTSVNLFESEMKYLHDNGFIALTLKDLAYDDNRGTLVIKDTI